MGAPDAIALAIRPTRWPANLGLISDAHVEPMRATLASGRGRKRRALLEDFRSSPHGCLGFGESVWWYFDEA